MNKKKKKFKEPKVFIQESFASDGFINLHIYYPETNLFFFSFPSFFYQIISPFLDSRVLNHFY